MKTDFHNIYTLHDYDTANRVDETVLHSQFDAAPLLRNREAKRIEDKRAGAEAAVDAGSSSVIVRRSGGYRGRVSAVRGRSRLLQTDLH